MFVVCCLPFSLFVKSKAVEVFTLPTIQMNLMIPKSLMFLRLLTNESMYFNVRQEFVDPQVFNDPKGIEIGKMDF